MCQEHKFAFDNPSSLWLSVVCQKLDSARESGAGELMHPIGSL